MAVGDVYKCDLHYHVWEKHFVTQYHYRETQEDTHPLVASAIAAAWQIAILPAFRELVCGECIIGALHVRRIVGGKGPTARGYFVDGYGLRPMEAMPSNQALRIKLNGTHQGRPNRGAQMISGISEGSVTGNQFEPAFLSTRVPPYLTALATDLVGVAPSTGEWEFGYMARAGVLVTDPPLAWPGEFVKPSSMNGQTIPATIRDRQGDNQAVRTT